ncbi:3-oxoacyl-[acyl-carrier-protein] synthase 3 A, chloroplastic [Glycine soja]|uniref:3-oxoacyl-[acyl-carrier-protein] synthase 3 A, chloroplastic n=1 Tax=Glycine soja TaxID=3848 RepID=A0A445FF13_GLYSO|nr:3-oxoacyl-[acyl-carrier-protein] synthase 3 A, chloroplastic [Glycine soja]
MPPLPLSHARHHHHQMDFDLYDLLGIDNSCDQSQVKVAYCSLQKRCHPDIAGPAGHDIGGGFNNVLVIGADALSRYVDWTDRGTCILFGDAAGAVLVQACNSEEDGLFGFDLHSDGSGQRHLNASIKANKSNNALDSNGSVVGFPPKQSSYSCIQMNGKEVFRFAV